MHVYMYIYVHYVYICIYIYKIRVHKIQFYFVHQNYRQPKEVIIQKSGGTLL